ncbi:hypothetical protein ACFPK5_25100 [Streptomyces beijiangensis]
MSLLATTPGKRLVMPRRTTAGGLDALMAHSPQWKEWWGREGPAEAGVR